ncbi:hypothetical protein [Methylobacterium sp. J-090]|uniref:hypothetical protein n=1 Tax=Methylobacterium sp. J-090 TaxID=2836666 RepID=UPI001FB87BB4|nr:hypothetical protein [Methylobacterium sp. J-090]MCJ2082449.1 hypothetical protein [Methylobacterium sp. J-090]
MIAAAMRGMLQTSPEAKVSFTEPNGPVQFGHVTLKRRPMTSISLQMTMPTHAWATRSKRDTGEVTA